MNSNENKFKQVLENTGPKFKVGDIGHPSNDFTPAGTGRIEIIGIFGYGADLVYEIKFLDRDDKNITMNYSIIDFMYNSSTEMVLYGQ